MVFFAYGASTEGAFIDLASDTTEYFIGLILIGVFGASLVTLNVRRTLFAAWYLLNWLQYTRLLILINAPTDTHLIYFFKKISKGFNGHQLIKYYDRTNLPGKFSQIDVQGYYFISNTDKYLIVFLGSIIIYDILRVIGSFSDNFKKLKLILEQIYMDTSFRLVLICIYDFYIFGLLQFCSFSFDSNYEMGCILFAAVALLIGVTALVLIPFYIDSQLEKKNYSFTLLNEFSCETWASSSYYFVFLTTRIISAIVLVFCQSLQYLQIVMILLCIIANIVYISYYRPYAKKIISYCVITAETSQLAIVVLVAIYNAYPSPATLSFLNWSCFFFFWLGILACCLRGLITLFTSTVKETDQNNAIPNFRNLFRELSIKFKRRKSSKAYLESDDKSDEKIKRVNLECSEANISEISLHEEVKENKVAYTFHSSS
jgi:hypothetical protein